MQVIKRNGQRQDVAFDKITFRIKQLAIKLPQLTHVNPTLVAQKVVAGLVDGITTTQLDELAAEVSIFMSTIHPDYSQLASRIAISNLHKNTSDSYEEVIDQLYHHYTNVYNDKIHSLLISKHYYDLMKKYIDVLQNALNYEYDYNYDYFGLKTLIAQTYLFKVNDQVVERPQHMLMRVSVGIHGDDLTKVIESYHLMANKFFTHASPTMFNACTPMQQMSSCFLMTIKEDSIDGIYDTLKQAALISKSAGGIGLSVHNVRAKGSYIRSTSGYAEGLIPMLKVFNDTARFVNQSSKRKGAFAIYLEPHHPDIEDFLDLKKNHGKEELRARDLFYALWISDLFMTRVENNQMWSLFCPDECPGLSEVYGDDYVKLYTKYEQEGRARKVIKAQDLWYHIVNTQIETGTPYMLYKDTINNHNNQCNLGTIKSSNLCVAGETFILTDQGQIPIKKLVNQNVNVWNGEEWSSTTIYQTGQNKNLLKITMSNGSILECTPEHHFYIMKDNKQIMVEAQELKVNDQLIKFKLPDDIEYDNIKILSIVQGQQGVDTYCFNEKKRHMGIFNNVLLGNCSEIVEYSSLEEISVCTLASIALPSFVINNTFDHQKLFDVCYHVVGNLNKLIDVNYYPVNETRFSNFKHRPLGIGVQGLADVFYILRYPYTSLDARQLNIDIFETMYYACLRASCDLSKQYGPYESFVGSPASKGLLNQDIWGISVNNNRWNFDEVRHDILKYGLRNSLLLALMPTASTSQILGFTESFEPLTSNFYSRRVLAGEFTVINKYLVEDLIKLNMWNEQTKNKIIIDGGSVQKLDIPIELKELYKTVWELKMRDLIDMSADRTPFICQSQSFNAFMDVPNKSKLTSMHFYAWKKKLKTGMYYLRTKSATKAIQFSIDPKINDKKEDQNCDEGCLMCSS